MRGLQILFKNESKDFLWGASKMTKIYIARLELGRGWQAHFFKFRKSKICKFFSSFRNGKSANFLGRPVRNSQTSKFIWLIAYLQFLQNTGALFAIFVSWKGMYLRACGSFNSANRKKDCVRKSQIRKGSHLRKIRKSNNLFKSANLRNLRFADRPALQL